MQLSRNHGEYIMANNLEEPTTQMANMLRSRLTDPNPNRYGDNWIFDDWPRLDLKKNSYPRISVTSPTETGEIIDINGTMEYTPRLQIDVWVWAGIDGQDSMILTIGGYKYEGYKLLTYIKRQVLNTLDDDKSDFYDDTNVMYNYSLLASVNMGQDPDRKQIIRHRIDVSYDMFRG